MASKLAFRISIYKQHKAPLISLLNQPFTDNNSSCNNNSFNNSNSNKCFLIQFRIKQNRRWPKRKVDRIALESTDALFKANLVLKLEWDGHGETLDAGCSGLIPGSARISRIQLPGLVGG